MCAAIRFLIGIIGLGLSIFVVIFHKNEFHPMVWLCLWAMFAVIGVIELKGYRFDVFHCRGNNGIGGKFIPVME